MTTTEGRTQIQPVRIHNLELLGEKASMRANLHQLALRVCLGGIILIALIDVESPSPLWTAPFLRRGSRTV